MHTAGRRVLFTFSSSSACYPPRVDLVPSPNGPIVVENALYWNYVPGLLWRSGGASVGIPHSEFRSLAFASIVGLGIVVFATTNIDDILLLAAFFADRTLTARSVVIGQFAGIRG